MATVHITDQNVLAELAFYGIEGDTFETVSWDEFEDTNNMRSYVEGEGGIVFRLPEGSDPELGGVAAVYPGEYHIHEEAAA